MSFAFNDYHDTLYDMGEVKCTNCFWYGDASECDITEWDEQICPHCTHEVKDGIENPVFDPEWISEALADLMCCVVRFNSKQDRYGAGLELDHTGKICFLIVDTTWFDQEKSRALDGFIFFRHPYSKCPGYILKPHRPFDPTALRDWIGLMTKLLDAPHDEVSNND